MRTPYVPAFFGIALALFSGCSDKKSPEATRRQQLEEFLTKASLMPAKVVDTGRIEYSDGPLKSEDFSHCAAVILDCGDSAFYAHALPGPFDVYPRPIDLTNVVEKLDAKVRERKINPQGCSAILFTDNLVTQERLERRLNERDIPVGIKAFINAGTLYNVYYNPKSNFLFLDPVIGLEAH